MPRPVVVVMLGLPCGIPAGTGTGEGRGAWVMHAAAEHAATQRARVERQPAEAVTDRTWPIAAIFFPSVVAAYAVFVGVIYLLATSMSWQALAAGGLLVLLFNVVLLFVLLFRTMSMERTRQAPALTAQRDD